MQHRANPQVRGRHRRTALHSHRAPRAPFGEKGRYAMVTAALVAGVGVAGVSAAAAGAAPSHPDTTSLQAMTRTGSHAAERAAQPGSATPETVPEGTTALSAAEQAAGEQAGIQLEATHLEAAEHRARRGLSARDHAVGTQGHGAHPPVVPPIADAAAKAASPVRHKPRPKPVVTAVPTVRWVNPLPEASVTSCYGQRWGRLHAGVDLAAANGTRIRAAGAGTVVQAGAAAGYGNAVLIDHGNGFLTHYGHMSTITVAAGQHVAVGEEIGHEGSTGHSTGPHLHFEVHEGSYKNPIEPTAWMHEHGVDIPGCADLDEK